MTHKKLKIFFCLLLTSSSFFLIVYTADDIGWTWDEVYYFMSSELQVEWFDAFFSSIFNDGIDFVLSRKVVDEYWLWDISHNPHPPLYKILSSIGWVLFRDNLGDFAAYRLSSAFLSGVLILFLFCAIEKKHGILPAIYGSLCLLLMPRFFGHAHFATTEIPVAAFWFLSYWAFWRGLERVSGSVLLGLLFGCALATKFTAVLIPFPFLLWTLIYREKRAFRNMVFLVLLSPVLAVLLNPGWWHQPIQKIINFIQISLSREETIAIGTFFMGERYSFSPPWFYPLVMIAVTVPITGIFMALLGAVSALKEKLESSYDCLFLVNIPFILAVVMLPKAPVHDGVRQFFPLLPFLAYLSGMGFHYLSELISSLPFRRNTRSCVIYLCLIFAVGYPAYQLKKIHPYEISYYNELAGGLSGAHKRGMEITYWFDAANDHFLNVLANDIPSGAKISIWPPNVGYFTFLQDKGKIKKDVMFFSPDIKIIVRKKSTNLKFEPEQPEYLILLSRLATFNLLYWGIFKNCTPVFSLKHGGIPLVSIYRWQDILNRLKSAPGSISGT